MKDPLYKEEYMRERYPTEEEYFERNTAFNTYAVVTPNGVWHEPGEMGWWGLSSMTAEDEREWDSGYYERFIQPALDHNWYMVIVDCHI
ncbi:MAG: hypothetical protein LBJ12_08280 [Oscillospiraceae bacterium]|nr:hypothetical protein [Oscillospiraceae bacterium]